MDYSMTKSKDLNLKPISEEELDYQYDPEYVKYLADLECDGEEIMVMQGRFQDYYYPIYPHAALEIRTERRKRKQ